MSRAEIDRHGARLLAALAADPEDEACAREFDSLLYPLIWGYLRANHVVLGGRVARYIGVEGAVAPQILPEEVDEVAHAATVVALRRVRNHPGRFDPDRGTASGWAINAAEFAYVEVAKDIVRARRSVELQYKDPVDIAELADAPSHESAVERRIVDAEDLADAASHVSELEWTALRLVITLGYSYTDAAEKIYGDSSMSNHVDNLLQRGKRKLAAAWSDRRPTARGASSPGASSPNVSDGTDDREGANE